MQRLQIELGDVSGHDFHGNQWTGGRGGEDGKPGDSIKGIAGNNALRAAMARGLSYTSAQDYDPARILINSNEDQRGAAKAEIVAAAGKDIADAAAKDGPVRDEMNTQYPDTVNQGTGESGQRSKLEGDWIDRQRGDWTDEDLAALSNEQLYGEIKAQNYVDTWASSAADSDPLSLVMQQETVGLLGADSKSFNSYLEKNDLLPPVGGPDQETYTSREGDTIRAFIQGEYDRTQTFLKENGITEVTLHRGFNTSDSYPEPGAYPIDMNPASSWSVDRETAENFATSGSGIAISNDYILTMTVPASDIISTARTGQGALHEGEVIVRNQPGHIAYVDGVYE